MARERKFSKEELYQITKKLLLDHGYDGYTFTLLANQLEVSRAAIYKYYDNKEELLIEYMVFELNTFLQHLKEISKKDTFMDQFEALFDIIFNDMSIYKIREIGMHIPTVNDKVAAYKKKLDRLHVELYDSLQGFIRLGREEKVLKEDIPSNLVLGMIFQTVNIPNTTGLTHLEWVNTLKKVICHGMFRNAN
ncbi:TetR/AcrR family transcriptional regulator [Ornithinibacillus scapharcae]|uniref:TetR/AcrR family transcriptional regulator n=1 Tax=Ornithinibacillus scapharcae TaxID=1147159 RepID=UPI000225C0EC|nr:TetR/AcrR family transcriptional regulator [Ornithinibacillus scapharcae]